MNHNLIDTVQFTCEGIISIMSLFSLGILIKENNRLKKEVKMIFYRSFIVLAIACIAGWTSLLMNGHSENYTLLHAFVKSLDYIFFPYVCVTVADMVNYTKYRKWIMIIIIANAIFELASIFTGWSFYIDEGFCYQSGSFHFIYHISIYSSIFYLLLALFNYGRSFKKENRFSLITILSILVVAVVLQEAFSIRVMFAGVAPTIILLFIHINEFSQLKIDEELEFKNQLLSLDALTGLGSRFSFNKELEKIKNTDSLPDNFVALTIDINGLKITNDTYGHVEGDKIICATGDIIKEVLGRYGICYRVGGDEYIIFAQIDKENIKSICNEFNKKVDDWNGGPRKLTVSLGYCYKDETEDQSISSIMKKADERMLKNKNDYYIKNKIDRRKQISNDFISQ